MSNETAATSKISQNTIFRVVFSALIFVFTYLVSFKLAKITSDYSIHAKSAETFWQHFPNELSYPLWHFGVYLLYLVSRKYLSGALDFSCAFFSAFVNAILYNIICNSIDKKSHSILLSIGGFLLCIVSPVYLPFFNKEIYIGQGSPNTWHNPTNLMVKPFAVLSFFMLSWLIDSIKKSKELEKRRVFLVSTLLLIGVFAKPSFFQGFFPAVMFYILALVMSDKFTHVKEYAIILVAFIPAIVIVLAQFFLNFYSGTSGEGVSIGWAVVASHSSPNYMVSLLLVLLFPLLYTMGNRGILLNTDVQLAWLFLLFSWCEYMMLYENGRRMYSGNFGWALQLSFTVLWIVICRYYFEDIGKMFMGGERKKNNIIKALWKLCLTGVFIWHTASGALYLYQMISIPDKLF